MRIIGYRHQRTLAAAANVAGVGFITGAKVAARLCPAAPGSGLVFRRVDLPGAPEVPAHTDSVTSTNRRTTLGPPETGVTLAEHVLAALAGLRIDNCVIELDGPEPPGLDGSALGFANAILAAGAVSQVARRPIFTVTETTVVRSAGATLAIHPAATTELHATYRLDYGIGSSIPPQSHTARVSPADFALAIAQCRTFLTEPEAKSLRAAGVGKHLGPADLLVFGARGPIANRTRFADEPARHKILDLIGDLALCGFDLAGHVVAYRSGHTLNAELARLLGSHIGSQKSSSRKVVKSEKQAA